MLLKARYYIFMNCDYNDIKRNLQRTHKVASKSARICSSLFASQHFYSDGYYLLEFLDENSARINIIRKSKDFDETSGRIQQAGHCHWMCLELIKNKQSVLPPKVFSFMIDNIFLQPRVEWISHHFPATFDENEKKSDLMGRTINSRRFDWEYVALGCDTFWLESQYTFQKNDVFIH